MAMTFERIFNPTPLRRLWKRLFPSKEMRAYRKMYRRHRREMVKLAKKVHEWDYGWIDELVLTQIKHMYEYFSEGNNVWQADESRLKIVEQLKRVLDAEAEIDRMHDDNNGVEFVCEGDKVWAVYPDNYTERVQKWEERQQELYEEIYGTIAKYMRWWWD